MSMDPQLAALYGTNQDEADVEKLAAAQLAEELASEEPSETEKLAELSDEEAEALSQELLSAEAGEPAAEVEEPETEEEQKAQGDEEAEEAAVEEPEKTSAAQAEPDAKQKVAEADYLGRVMAHSYVQELRKIAADAQAKEPVKEQPKAKTAAKAGKVGGKVAAFLKGKKAAAEPQEPSALDTLAARRAAEILTANGFDPETGAPVEQAEKAAAAEEPAEDPRMAQLAEKVEARAVAMLQERGFEFEQPEQE